MKSELSFLQIYVLATLLDGEHNRYQIAARAENDAILHIWVRQRSVYQVIAKLESMGLVEPGRSPASYRLTEFGLKRLDFTTEHLRTLYGILVTRRDKRI